ncbi:hypothetical protein pipiens_003640 [Culex pipiens pipiens]|uniref:Uncharacterized protein n=1 Tax=Culex pipiens pipiens TaxID=38569 RepID=A0ABD1CUN9_CULPP
MAPPRRRRYPASRKPKVDHSSYVQSLFREFLHRNQAANKPPAPIPAAPKVQEANRRPNVYRESIARMLQQQQQVTSPSSSLNRQEQQNIVKQFFQIGSTNQVERVPQRLGPMEPVCVRFKRKEGSDQFFKRELSPGAPTGGLMKWLADRKRERLEREERERNRAKKVEEYINLPDNFFSGRPAFKLPFELEQEPASANKTLASIASAFVPPVASTPLDRILPPVYPSFISDPRGVPAPVEVPVPKPKRIAKEEGLEFIKKFNAALESFSAILAAADGGINRVDRNLAELRRLVTKRPVLPKPFLITPKTEGSSMFVKVQLGCDRKHVTPPSAYSVSDSTSAGDSTFEREVLQLIGTTPVKRKRIVEVDPLLTYSPPIPKLDPDLELPPPPKSRPNATLNTSFLSSNGSLISPGGTGSQPNDGNSSMVIRVQLGSDRRRPVQSAAPSISYLNSTFAREVLQLTVPKEMCQSKLDPLLLYSPPYPSLEPKKKQICRREPDFSFLDGSSHRLSRPESIPSQGSVQKQPDFAFDDDQENFGPIFPSQDGPRPGANTTIDFNASLSVEDPFELRFSQGSIWERF